MPSIPRQIPTARIEALILRVQSWLPKAEPCIADDVRSLIALVRDLETALIQPGGLSRTPPEIAERLRKSGVGQDDDE